MTCSKSLTTQIHTRISLKNLIVRELRSFLKMLLFTAGLGSNIILLPIHLDRSKTSKSGMIDIKCSPYAGSNNAYAAFDSYGVFATLRE